MKNSKITKIKVNKKMKDIILLKYKKFLKKIMKVKQMIMKNTKIQECSHHQVGLVLYLVVDFQHTQPQIYFFLLKNHQI